MASWKESATGELIKIIFIGEEPWMLEALDWLWILIYFGEILLQESKQRDRAKF